MSWFRLVPIAAGILVGATALPAQQRADEAGVRAALNHYIQGHATGDGSHMKIAFHPNANLYFIRDGKYAERTSVDYAAGFSGRPPADEAQRKRRIVSVHITGNAAIATIELDYPAIHFIDYITLLKVGDEWRIINKSYYGAPRTR